jgi:hypothetical protein
MQLRYVYVAGPISQGNQFVNVRTAVMVGERLRQAGLVPFVPHLSAVHELIYPVPYEEWMAYDFAWIERCDALLRIPGPSSGADREVAHARKLEMPVFYDTGTLIAASRALAKAGA